jgi:hypothetical protein
MEVIIDGIHLSATRPRGEIVLDEAGHTYHVGDQELISVTKVIESVLRIDSHYWKAQHRLRGQFVHQIIQAINDRDWDADSTVVPAGFDRDEIINRGYGYQSFIEQTGFRPILSEFRVADAKIGIAGTLDTYGLITKGSYAGRYAIADAKSGLPTAAAILQLALYEHCFRVGDTLAYITPNLRIILELRRDGSIRPTFHEGKSDIMDALALIRIWNFKKRNGIL